MTNSHVRLNVKQRFTFFILIPFSRSQMPPGRREMYNFPQESLECTQVRYLTQSFTKNQLLLLQTNSRLISFNPQPLLNRRKRLTKVDVQPVEGWRGFEHNNAILETILRKILLKLGKQRKGNGTD